MAKKKEKLSFEEAIAGLEEYSDKLRSKDITLEESVDVYTKSIELYNTCCKILEEAKQKVEIVNPETGEVSSFDE